jgi:hypothetical protein
MAEQQTLSHDDMFSILVFNFQQSAMIGMGKLQNPVTGETQRSLPDAKFSIDMLEMLDVKSKGNQTPEQENLLKQILTNLRLNFIEEQNKPDEPETPPENQEASDAAEETPKPEEETPDTDATDDGDAES